MKLTSKATLGRWITLGLLMATSCGNLGCRSFTGHGCELVAQPHVCPTCKARSVEACRCFPHTEYAGYHETHWASLDPNIYYGASSRAGMEYKSEAFEAGRIKAERFEAVPALEMRSIEEPPPAVGDQGSRSRPSRTIAPVAHWELAEPPASSSVQDSAVSVRIADDGPTYDYYRP